MEMSKLKAEYFNSMQRMNKLFQEFPWESKDAYLNWMGQTYFYIFHSTRVITMAASFFSADRQDFHHRFIEHSKEEKGHEKILVLDLKNLGCDVSAFEPYPATEALFQTQNYWIQCHTPLAVYGYFLFLEGLAVECGEEIYKRTLKTYGDKATRFLKVHVEEDKDHVESHFEHLERTSDKERESILKNMRQAEFLYSSFVRQIMEQLAVKKAA